MASFDTAMEIPMLELIVTDMNDANGLYRVAQAITHADGQSRCQVGQGWVRVDSAWPAARFLAAIRQAGFNAVVWWDGRRRAGRVLSENGT